MAIFYLKESVINDKIVVKDELFHHLKNVLRVKKGEVIRLFNNNAIFFCSIEEVNKSEIILSVNNVEDIKPDPFTFEIAQALIDKMELELAIRLLVTSKVKKIYLFRAKRSNFDLKEKHLERLKEIALNTAEQSEVCFVPEIIYIENLKDLINLVKENAFALDFDTTFSLKDVKNLADLTKPIRFFVGPEGGFTYEEKAIFRNEGIKSLNLKSGVFKSQFAGSIAVLTTLELMSL